MHNLWMRRSDGKGSGRLFSFTTELARLLHIIDELQKKIDEAPLEELKGLMKEWERLAGINRVFADVKRCAEDLQRILDEAGEEK